MSEFKNVAIARTKHGSVQFAIIDEDGIVVAVAKSKGGIYQINFIENTPTEQKQVLDYLTKNKSYFENF